MALGRARPQRSGTRGHGPRADERTAATLSAAVADPADALADDPGAGDHGGQRAADLDGVPGLRAAWRALPVVSAAPVGAARVAAPRSLARGRALDAFHVRLAAGRERRRLPGVRPRQR